VNGREQNCEGGLDEIPAVVGEWHAETAPVFEAAALKCRSPLYFAERCLQVVDVKKDADRQIFTLQTLDDTLFSAHEFTVSLDLLGDYQQKNIVTALVSIAVLRRNGFEMKFDGVTKACASAARITALQGRWQTSGSNPMLIFDTGHNAHGITYVTAQLKEMPYRKLYMVFGVVNDKDIAAILPLLPRDAYYFFTQANIPRAMNVETLAERCMSAGLQGEIQATVQKALAAAKSRASDGDIIFVGGSSFVVAEAL
jgi:dihydrofolate synthase/folylpolyglutamate synthase